MPVPEAHGAWGGPPLTRRSSFLVVVVLGGSEQPVDRTEVDCEAQATGDVLACDGTRRLEDNNLFVANFESRPHRVPWSPGGGLGSKQL